MTTRNLGQDNCPHKELRTETVVHRDENGKEVIRDEDRVIFDRIFCDDCDARLGDKNLRLEPILISIS